MKTNKYLRFGEYIKGCPKNLLAEVRKIKKGNNQKNYITKLLEIISEEFNPRKYNTTYTNNFNKSRFIAVRNILKKRQRSCGSQATVVASVLRNLNIPTKLIDGLYIKDNPKMRHVWNEIYINKKWLPFDIIKKDFKIGKYHVRKGEWVDWGDLEKVINNKQND